MGQKKPVKKGKKPHKNKPTSKKYAKYKIEGNKIIRAKTCPRCGPGIFLMTASDRVYCGKCHYSEFVSKKPAEESKPQENKEEKKEESGKVEEKKQ